MKIHNRSPPAIKSRRGRKRKKSENVRKERPESRLRGLKAR